ncbi:hypothetical protein TRVL_10068 [Trypanosoma vivax]|nr:hypothetical protein TRVL_10068 [Trypanosoma vivax]
MRRPHFARQSFAASLTAASLVSFHQRLSLLIRQYSHFRYGCLATSKKNTLSRQDKLLLLVHPLSSQLTRCLTRTTTQRTPFLTTVRNHGHKQVLSVPALLALTTFKRITPVHASVPQCPRWARIQTRALGSAQAQDCVWLSGGCHWASPCPQTALKVNLASASDSEASRVDRIIHIRYPTSVSSSTTQRHPSPPQPMHHAAPSQAGRFTHVTSTHGVGAHSHDTVHTCSTRAPPGRSTRMLTRQQTESQNAFNTSWATTRSPLIVLKRRHLFFERHHFFAHYWVMKKKRTGVHARTVQLHSKAGRVWRHTPSGRKRHHARTGMIRSSAWMKGIGKIAQARNKILLLSVTT